MNKIIYYGGSPKSTLSRQEGRVRVLNSSAQPINAYSMTEEYAIEQGREFFHLPGQGNTLNSKQGGVDTVKNASLVVMWSDTQFLAKNLTDICLRRNIPVAYVEWGMLPQKTNFFVDPSGLLGNSIVAKDLSWINDEDMDSLFNKRKELQQEYKINPQGHILVPLQLDNDTSILHHSHYSSAAELLEYIEYIFPRTKILVKMHPNQHLTESIPGSIEVGKKFLRPPQLPLLQERFKKMEFLNEGNMMEMSSKADLVVGISSTCLYEAGVLGVPVLPLGNHPLRIHKKQNYDKVLAGALALNIPRKSRLGPILERFNIRPLQK